MYFLENSKSSTSADIKNKTAIDDMGHIFLEHKLPVSGYLVAWQYYVNIDGGRFRVCTNTSYAAIIRRNGNKYTMIAKTLLAPEDFTNAGVRFQFIQNEVIRVQKDDLIAAFTHRGFLSECNQLISVHPTSGSNTLTIAISAESYDVNKTYTFPSGYYDLADPALKAYVSGIDQLLAR